MLAPDGDAAANHGAMRDIMKAAHKIDGQQSILFKAENSRHSGRWDLPICQRLCMTFPSVTVMGLLGQCVVEIRQVYALVTPTSAGASTLVISDRAFVLCLLRLPFRRSIWYFVSGMVCGDLVIGCSIRFFYCVLFVVIGGRISLSGHDRKGTPGEFVLSEWLFFCRAFFSPVVYDIVVGCYLYTGVF